MKKQTKFQVGQNNISWIGSEFQKWFGDMTFTEPTKFQPLTSKKLTRSKNDTEILTELKPDEVTLADVYETLKTMDRSIWAIFYVKDKDLLLRTVSVDWHGGGWYVGARGVSDPDRWDGGLRVFSRNFFDTETKTLIISDPLTLSDELQKAIEQVKAAGYQVSKLM